MSVQYHVTIKPLTIVLLAKCSHEGADFVPSSTPIALNDKNETIIVLDSDVYWDLVEQSMGRTVDETLADQCRMYLRLIAPPKD